MSPLVDLPNVTHEQGGTNMATTDRRYPAITLYDAALCAVFGALVSAALTLAVQDTSWTHGATACAQPITTGTHDTVVHPGGVIAVTNDSCHP
ncbi:hypothetical protein KZ780_05055 [Mycolicibacterium smegmatis]|nr:hypothetical protein KZ780_05055 [Mycolicibacterium smegmatis]